MKFKTFALLSILFILVACQPIQPAKPPESTGEKILKALVREGVSQNMSEFTASSDLFRLRVPPDWVIEEHDDGSGVIMANSAAALARFQQGDPPEPGDAVFNTTLAPLAFFGTLLLEVEPGLSTANLATAIMPAFSGRDGAEVSEPQFIGLGGGRDAAAMITTNASATGALVLFEIAEGVVALNTIVGHPGELDAADIETAVRVITGSLEFTGTVDALIDAIDPVQPLDATFG